MQLWSATFILQTCLVPEVKVLLCKSESVYRNMKFVLVAVSYTQKNLRVIKNFAFCFSFWRQWLMLRPIRRLEISPVRMLDLCVWTKIRTRTASILVSWKLLGPRRTAALPDLCVITAQPHREYLLLLISEATRF